ncbi:MAG: hypothetical protein WCO60_16880 [Verrucomicrobiota bacterium]
MLIPPPYTSMPALHPDTFAIPCLNWTTAPVHLELDDLGSFRGMFTNLQRRGFVDICEHYLPNAKTAGMLYSADINDLELQLLSEINSTTALWNTKNQIPTDEDLVRIAVGIQLWGGTTGRYPFIREGGFSYNFSVESYRTILHHLRTSPPLIGELPNANLEQAKALWCGDTFKYFGVSFATKHFSFWSRAKGMPTALPIYDNIIAKMVTGRDKADWRHYWPYVNGMHTAVAQINRENPHLGGAYSVTQLERQLFVWAGSSESTAWRREVA